MSDDFFIGYRPRQPASTARFISVTAGGLLVLAAVLATILAASQNEPADATFEFGLYREYSGIVRIDPYPRLERAGGTTLLLVAPFKHGADDIVAPYRGAQVTLDGSLIERGRLRMVEIDPGSIVADEAAAARDSGNEAAAADPSVADLAPITVRGEIVDGKCWLGVMKPGYGTAHRACARLCLRGGIPALLDFVDEDGRRHAVLLTTAGGETPGNDVLKYVARPLELTGVFDPDAAGGVGTFAVDVEAIRIL